MPKNKIKISMLMLTYNAPRYVIESITGIKNKTEKDGFEYELVVVDNNSRLLTRLIVRFLKMIGYIDVLYMNDHNSLFAGGNNIAANIADSNSKLLLLINSDVRINDSQWLNNLIKQHKVGVTAYGIVNNPTRADGYCYLIDTHLYRKYPLDEKYEWWWSITKQQAKVLKQYTVQAYRNHEKWLYHYGGKSGKGYKDAKGMDTEISKVKKWFANGKPVIEL